MAGMSYAPAPPPMQLYVNVVNPNLCVNYPVDLIISKKVMSLAEGAFGVTDINDNPMFTVKGKLFSIHDRRFLLDTAGNVLITLQQKILSAHRRWEVFSGESKNLLFSVRKSSLLQFKTKLDVFLAANTKEDICDFRIEGSYLERSCVIYAGNSNSIIAQMHKKHSIQRGLTWTAERGSNVGDYRVKGEEENKIAAIEKW